jgi:hypothetical protein
MYPYTGCQRKNASTPHFALAAAATLSPSPTAHPTVASSQLHACVRRTQNTLHRRWSNAQGASLREACERPSVLKVREASSFSEALSSAIRDLTRALPALVVVRVEPDDLVSMATIAKCAGRSREYIRLLANDQRRPGGFPPPVAYVDDKTRLWHLPDVAHWLTQHHKARLDVDPEAADLVAALNAAYDLRKHTRHLPPTVLRSRGPARRTRCDASAC